MLLFLNFDCVLCVPADAAGPQGRGDTGIRRLESVLNAWPALRVVITSDRRYHWTLEHFRGFLAPEFQHRVIATTLLYDPRAPSGRRTREHEILDWLELVGADHSEWLALDDRHADYDANSDRLLVCHGITGLVQDELHAGLLSYAGHFEALVAPGHEVAPTAADVIWHRRPRHGEQHMPELPDRRAAVPKSMASGLRSP